MEYLGSLPPRKVDIKRRIIWPVEWLDDKDKYGFLFVQEKKHIKIYPCLTWKLVMNAMAKEPEKIAWSKKSTPVEHLDKDKRLLLPKECNWRKIDFIGMVEYIIIRESTG